MIFGFLLSKELSTFVFNPLQTSQFRWCLRFRITGISFRLVAVIETEVGDFHSFSSPDKILAFAVLSSITYQSGKYTSQNAVMEKRGSRYLRCACFCLLTLLADIQRLLPLT